MLWQISNVTCACESLYSEQQSQSRNSAISESNFLSRVGYLSLTHSLSAISENIATYCRKPDSLGYIFVADKNGSNFNYGAVIGAKAAELVK